MAETVSQAAQAPSDELEVPQQQTTRKNIKSKEHKEVRLVDSDPEKIALIGANLDAKQEDTIVRFLRDNVSVFAWKPADIPGVLRNLIEHSLNVSKTARPIKQKL
jgi:hypothetical protein